MFYPNVALLAAKNTFEVHQATHIGSRDDLGAMPNVVGNPVFPHFYRDGFLRHAKSAAESTAFVDPVKVAI